MSWLNDWALKNMRNTSVIFETQTLVTFKLESILFCKVSESTTVKRIPFTVPVSPIMAAALAFIVTPLASR